MHKPHNLSCNNHNTIVLQNIWGSVFTQTCSVPCLTEIFLKTHLLWSTTATYKPRHKNITCLLTDDAYGKLLSEITLLFNPESYVLANIILFLTLVLYCVSCEFHHIILVDNNNWKLLTMLILIFRKTFSTYLIYCFR